jgi:FkbM family methyltransferase
VPAKIIKYRFDECTIDRLLKIKWWDYGLPILEDVEWTNIDKALNQLEQKIADGIALWKPKLFKITKDGNVSEASSRDANKIAYKAPARSDIRKPINNGSRIENTFVKAESEMLDCYHHIKLPNYTTAYYGQHFEDVIILGILRAIYKEEFCFKTVTYIEIGANHPISGSNTYMFYKKGARGVLVEPNKDLHELLERVRRKDKLIKSCVTERANCNHIDYYYLNYNELNTTNKRFIEKWNENHPDKITSVVQKVSMPAVSINEILSEIFTDGNIDIFSIDIEGNEIAIIETINFTKYTPKIICMEWNTVFNGSKEDVKTIMNNKGYLLHSDTIVNGIFVLKKYF